MLFLHLFTSSQYSHISGYVDCTYMVGQFDCSQEPQGQYVSAVMFRNVYRQAIGMLTAVVDGWYRQRNKENGRRVGE